MWRTRADSKVISQKYTCTTISVSLVSSKIECAGIGPIKSVCFFAKKNFAKLANIHIYVPLLQRPLRIKSFRVEVKLQVSMEGTCLSVRLFSLIKHYLPYALPFPTHHKDQQALCISITNERDNIYNLRSAVYAVQVDGSKEKRNETIVLFKCGTY